MIFLVIWLVALASLIAISILRKRDWLRKSAKVVSIIMGILTLIPLLLFSIIFIGCEPPSLSSLSRNFDKRHAILEAIHQMSDEDPAFGRIDPTFEYHSAFSGYDAGESMAGDKHSPLSSERWSQYDALFSQAGLHQGISRDEVGNLFFMADSIGLLNRGHSTGYLFCVDPGASESQKSRFEPCTIRNADHGSSSENAPEAYTYKKVAEHWYVFDQGPS